MHKLVSRRNNYRPIILSKGAGRIFHKPETSTHTVHSLNDDVDKWFRREYNKLLIRDSKVVNNELYQAMSSGDIVKAVELFNIALAEIPYDNPRSKKKDSEDKDKNEWRNEFWYRSLFMMLLRGADIISYAEVHVQGGRSDLVIQFSDITIVLEFKITDDKSTIEQKIKDGTKQIREKGYAKGYQSANRKVICAVIVADNSKGEVKVEVIDLNNDNLLEGHSDEVVS